MQATPETTGVSRRSFLKRVAAAGGSVALYQSMSALGLLSGCSAAPAYRRELSLAPGAGTEVLIIGAGIAGLTAAYELTKAGYSCRILEADSRAGGRVETIRAGDTVRELTHEQTCAFDAAPHLYVDMGAARIPHSHQHMLSYCREFGVALEQMIDESRSTLYHDTESFGGRTMTAHQLRNDARGYIAELLTKAIDRGALDRELSDDDEERLLDILFEWGDLDDDDRYRGSSQGVYTGTLEEPEAKTPVKLRKLLASDFWDMHFSDIGLDAGVMLQPVGGMDHVIGGFMSRVGDKVQLGRIVSEIKNTKNGVEVTHKDRQGNVRTDSAHFCISTIAFPAMAQVKTDFSAACKKAIADIHYEQAGKMAFQARRFWEFEHGIYGGVSWTNQDMTQMWYPSHGIHQEKGVLIGAYIWDDEPGLRFAGMSPEERVKMCLGQGQKIHPELGKNMSAAVSRSWVNTEFHRGGWAVQDQDFPEVLFEPQGRVYLAGEQLSPYGGWQEGAVVSARAVIQAISDRVAVRA